MSFVLSVALVRSKEAAFMRFRHIQILGIIAIKALALGLASIVLFLSR